ncbi:unnamed protein product [Rotaria sordida]|uniref:Mutator-like transposase domain-containing protein n=1 Tax=Rotaria sordida TaxID=392033 RepID=A0A819FHW3_9BILA|nr:unnamed protein product [Rotaria sordida]
MITAVEEAVVEADGVRDLVVSGDGAWLTRGYSSLHVIATLCSTTAKPKVIDTNWCSKTCTKCQGAESLRRVNFDLFKTFQENHECQLNFTGTSGAMEKEMIREMFCRSLSKYKIKYISYIGDGDAKVHSFLTSNSPYLGVRYYSAECFDRLSSMRKRFNLKITNRRKKRTIATVTSTTSAANDSFSESDDEMLFMLNDKDSIDITQDLIGLDLTDDDTNTDYELGGDD